MRTRLASAVLLALLTAVVATGVALAQWPTTCVDLNDIAEAHLDNHGNVGIYQQVFGDAAEAACQRDHQHDVQRSFAWALGGAGAAVTGTWPTSCVSLNDLAEAAAGRLGNVGIYQRIYVHDFQAERACRADHRADVVATFAWAIPPRDAPPPAPTPAPSPPPAAPAPTTDPDYERIRQVARARGASHDVAATVAADVVGRGSVDAFLRGTDDGVLYGRYACPYRSTACPLAPERPPPPPEPQIDPAIQPMWRVLASTSTGSWLTSAAAAQSVRVVVSSNLPSRTYADYSATHHIIRIKPTLLAERPQATAVSLAHELWHAISTIPWPRTFDQCVIDEVWGFIIGALVWYELLGWSEAWTDYEWDMRQSFLVLAGHPQGRADFDQDVSDWPWMLNHVLVDHNYADTCR